MTSESRAHGKLFLAREVEGGSQSPPESSSAERRVSVSGLPQPWLLLGYVPCGHREGAGGSFAITYECEHAVLLSPNMTKRARWPGAARHAVVLVDS